MGSVEFTLGIGLIGVAALMFGFELVPNEIAVLGVLVLLVLLEPWTLPCAWRPRRSRSSWPSRLPPAQRS
jgi:hypothetical protein